MQTPRTRRALLTALVVIGAMAPNAAAAPPVRHRIEITVYTIAQHPNIDLEIRYRRDKLPTDQMVVSHTNPPVYSVFYFLLARPGPHVRWIRIYVHNQSSPRRSLCMHEVERIEVEFDRRPMPCRKHVNQRGCAWDCRLREAPYR